MTCKFCGNEMDENEGFCPVCGQDAETDKPKAEQTPAADDVKDYQLDTDEGDVTVAVDEEPAPDEEGEAAPAEDAQPEEKKKPKKEKTKANFFLRLVSFLFILIGLIIYAVMKRRSTPEKAYSIANAILAGLCLRLAIIILYFMMSYGWISIDGLMPIIAKLTGQG